MAKLRGLNSKETKVKTMKYLTGLIDERNDAIAKLEEKLAQKDKEIILQIAIFNALEDWIGATGNLPYSKPTQAHKMEWWNNLDDEDKKKYIEWATNEFNKS